MYQDKSRSVLLSLRVHPRTTSCCKARVCWALGAFPVLWCISSSPHHFRSFVE